MKKKKFNLKKYADLCEEEEIAGKDGAVITVRNHIPYAQKEEMARELAEQMLMVHDDACMYLSSQYDKYEKYMIGKYYTNIDTDKVEIAEVADFMINNEIFEQIEDFIFDDLYEVGKIFDRLKDSVMKTYQDDKSLTKALRTSFSFLFTGEDITETLAKAESTKGTLVDAFNALRKVEEEKEEKIDNGELSIGGNIINFSKKKE